MKLNQGLQIMYFLRVLWEQLVKIIQSLLKMSYNLYKFIYLIMAVDLIFIF